MNYTKKKSFYMRLQCNHNEKGKCNFSQSGRLRLQESRGNSRRIKGLRDDKIRMHFCDTQGVLRGKQANERF